ncbi:Shr3 amino acid permease chaperone [Thelephora terrestris]|uniref:Shr3 amino acid permease chaperone n=1 Tax=Thelephora terrestris TaxID=56493 RepID=A0A9P6HTU6_9AGAM|nr:Shr3 amino acid permease chaperone [Thelephora terrestris]
MAAMNGTRVSVVVFATSFLLGLLFTHWIADSLTLWKPPATDERLWMAARYYFVIAQTSIGFLYFFAFVAIGGGFTILWCLREGEAGNLMFDGGSIFLYASALAVYMHTVLPNLNANFVPISEFAKEIPESLKRSTLELASSHLVCSVALTGVLALQAGRWWSENNGDPDD